MKISTLKISAQDFKSMFQTESSFEMTEVLVSKIKDIVFCQGSKLKSVKTYFLNKDNIWEQQTDFALCTEICRLLSEGRKEYINHLQENAEDQIGILDNQIKEIDGNDIDVEEKRRVRDLKREKYEILRNLKEIEKKVNKYKYIQTKNIKFDLLPDISRKLTNNEINLDDDQDGIHFINGRFNLKTGKLEKRLPQHYISQLSTNTGKYKPSTQKDRDFIMTEISKIFGRPEDRDFTLQTLGGMLSGAYVRQQVYVFFFGVGGSGKSFLLNLFKACVGDAYYQELQKETLLDANKSSSLKAKQLNSITPSKRIIHVNELDPNKCDGNLIKQICDGSIQNSALYQDGSKRVAIKGVLVITSNHMIVLHSDSGDRRRVMTYEFKMKFVEPHDAEYKNINNKTIFKKDRSFIDNLSSTKKNAFFDILASYCKKWYKGKALKPSKGYEEAKAELIESNDTWGNFIEDYFQKDEDARVAVNDVVEAFWSAYPNKRKSITRQVVIKEFKKQEIKYDRQLKADGCDKRGVFLGLTFKDVEEEEEDDLEKMAFEDPVIKNLKEENASLKERLSEMEAQLKKLLEEQKTQKKLEEKEPELKLIVESEESPKSSKTQKPKDKKASSKKSKPIKDQKKLSDDELDKMCKPVGKKVLSLSFK